jgi:hypothetical protein
VTYKPEEQLVRVNLTAPSVVDFDNGVVATEINDDNSKIIFEKTKTIKSPAPSASNRVEDKIDNCKSNCTDVGSSLGGNNSAGQYYTDDDLSVAGDTVFNTDDGDIEVIVDGNLTFDKDTGVKTEDQEIINGDNGQVRFYVKGSVKIAGAVGVNQDGTADDLLMLVHSSVDSVQMKGTSHFTGFIYAPNSDFLVNGAGVCGNPSNSNCENNVNGGVVADTAGANGKAYVEHSGSASIRLKFETSSDVLTFLHVSTNPVTISG